MKKNSSINKNIIFIVFFLQTISFVSAWNISWIKYVGILILNFEIIFLCIKKGVTKQEVIAFISIFTLLCISCSFQDTSFVQKIISMIFYGTLLIWTLLSYKMINKTEHILYICCGIIVAVIFSLIMTHDQISVQLNSIYNTRHRIWGGFEHPNSLGGILFTAIIGMYSYNFIKNIQNKRNKIIYYIFLILLTVLLYFTKSRTSWIITIVAILVMNIYRLRGIKAVQRVILYSLIILFCLFVGYYFIKYYALQDVAFMNRFKIFDRMTVTLKTFFVGNGMVNADNLNRGNTNGGVMEIAWVMLFYKNGIIGIISFISIILLILINARKVKDEKQKWVFIGILISFLLSSLGEAYIVNITNIPAMFNWIMLCVLSSNEFNKTLNSSKDTV